MAAIRRKAKSRQDNGGSFGALPRIVWKHPDYCKLTGNAVKLLMDLACQYNGRNNGDLTAAYTVLKSRGWSSKQTLLRATGELLDAGLIVRTREGRFLNPGGQCALYALAWKAIDDCPGKGLSTAPTRTPSRKFSLEIIETPGPECGPGSVQNVDRQRVRDGKGRYLSVQKRGRLMDTT